MWFLCACLCMNKVLPLSVARNKSFQTCSWTPVLKKQSSLTLHLLPPLRLHNPVRQVKTCHFRWSETFFKTGSAEKKWKRGKSATKQTSRRMISAGNRLWNVFLCLQILRSFSLSFASEKKPDTLFAKRGNKSWKAQGRYRTRWGPALNLWMTQRWRHKVTFEEVIGAIALSCLGIFHHVVSEFIHMTWRPERQWQWLLGRNSCMYDFLQLRWQARVDSAVHGLQLMTILIIQLIA